MWVLVHFTKIKHYWKPSLQWIQWVTVHFSIFQMLMLMLMLMVIKLFNCPVNNGYLIITLPLYDNSANQIFSASRTRPLATFFMAFFTPFPPSRRQVVKRMVLFYIVLEKWLFCGNHQQDFFIITYHASCHRSFLSLSHQATASRLVHSRVPLRQPNDLHVEKKGKQALFTSLLQSQREECEEKITLLDWGKKCYVTGHCYSASPLETIMITIIRTKELPDTLFTFNLHMAKLKGGITMVQQKQSQVVTADINFWWLTKSF